MGFGKDGKGMILYDEGSESLGTLAADTVQLIEGGYTSALTEDFRIVRMDYWAAWEGMAVNNGPIIFGVASGDLSAGEIKECLESRVFNRSKRIESETSMRPVWPLEIFSTMGDQTSDFQTGHTVAKGSVNLRWTFSDAAAWTFWVYNMSGDALAGASVLHAFAKIFGVWVT